jgi:WD40 repeat protein
LSLGLLAAMLVCAAAFLGIGASTAVGATPSTSYGYKSDIGTPDSGTFDFNGEVNAIAVSNDDGRVFISRQAENAIDIVGPDGTPIARPFTISPPSNIGVSADGGALFLSNALNIFSIPPTLEKLTSDGAPTPTYTADPSWAPSSSLNEVTGIAVDPTTGDLVVGAAGGTYRIDADSGAVLSSFDGSTSNRGAFKPKSLAIAPNGDVYAVVSPGRVEHMGADGSWKGELKIPQPENSISPSAIAVNPQNGDIAVELPQAAERAIKIYSASNDLKDTIRLPAAVAAGIVGLAFSPDGTKLYLGLKNGSAHVLLLGTRPGVDPPVASAITATGAHLTAAVATVGEPTTARIEYCVPSDPCGKYLGSEGASPWHVVSEESGLSNPVQDTISADLSGLEPSTKYLLRTSAVNEDSQVEGISGTDSFTTALVPPTVQTGQATSVTDTSATLAGTIDTFGGQTTYHFEYGLTTSYGSVAPAGAEGIAGSERALRTFTQTLKGLQPGTPYHFRLVATNAAGTTLGEDRTFTTLGADEVAPHRAYEMVTPPDKKGFAIYADYGFQASEDGSAIAYSASAPSSEAAGAAQASRYMSRRGASGWLGQTPLDPPINPVRAITFSVTQGVSDDFEHTLVFSQKALTPDAVEDAANIYVNDVDTGAYHLVGTTTQPGAFSQMVGPSSLNNFIAGAPDFSWVVLMSRYPLLPGASQVAMYKWTSTGGLSLVSLLPGDTVPTGNAWVQSNTGTTNPLISDDGETFAFSLTSGETGVYRRSGGETEAVSVSQATGGPPGPQPGIADGMSRDGRYVVFHSNAQLTDSANDGGPKMYRYDASSGQLDYLGPLNGTGDGSPDVRGIDDDGGTVYFNGNGQLLVWRGGQLDVVYPSSIQGTAGAYSSPNGRYFLFASGDGLVHLYDAVSGQETCASCLPSGPSSSTLPPADRNLSNRLPQVVTDDGHAYFMSTTPLVGADRNGTRDVYEYYNGRLTLISPGDRDYIATLAGISTDGSTVFFTTPESLVRQDTDQTYDLYAARVGGGFSEPPPPPAACSGEACRASNGAQPPNLNLGSSAVKDPRSSKPATIRCRKGTHKVTKTGKSRCVKNKSQNKKRDTKHNRRAGR